MQRPSAPSDAGPSRVAAALALLLAAAALALAGAFPVNNPDAYGHLAQGRVIAEQGGVPDHDPFSLWQAQPAPWHNYEWLSDLASYRAYEAGGANALIAIKCALLALAGALLVWFAIGLGGVRAGYACAWLAIVAIPAARFRFSERPHLVTLAFSALYLIGLSRLLRGDARGRERTGWLIAIPIVHVLWVNLHGSHLLGLAIAGVFFAIALRTESAALAPGTRRAHGLVLALMLVASCLSPFGPAILTDALAHVLDPRYRELVREWGAWQASDPPWLLLAPCLQTLLLALAARRLWRADALGRALLLVCVVLALASFRSIRFVAEYLLLSAPVLGWAFAERTRELPFGRFAALAVSAFVAAGAVVPAAAAALPPMLGLGFGQSMRGLPAASGAWLARSLPAPRLFAAIDDAWFLLFPVPRARVVIDGRVPFYGAEHLARSNRAFAEPAALAALLAQYRVDTVVLRHSFAAHARALAAMSVDPAFRLVAIEDSHALFVRSSVQLRDGSLPRALELVPGYRADWLLEVDDARAAAAQAALRALSKHDNARGYEGWVRGLLALRPLCREQCRAGLRPPASDAERATLANVQRWLEHTEHHADGVPMVSVFLALVAAARCDLEAAEAARQLAEREGESRETLLLAQEIALRRGQSAQVAAFLSQARALPGLAQDPWLAQLGRDVEAPPRCGP